MELKNEYPSLSGGARPTYGGSQMLSPRKIVRKCGCGPIAVADLLIYLSRSRAGCDTSLTKVIPLYGPAERSVYFSMLNSLCRRYTPMLYPIGTNGIFLAAGVNAYFRRNKIPLRASWCWGGKKLRTRIASMLENDLPVILAIGPNFPFMYSNRHKVTRYVRQGDRFRQKAKVNAHYVTVTGMEGDWMKISSWGAEFYISFNEYETYAKKHSLPLFTNIMLLSQKKMSPTT